ncbi:MAG: hypothetical protein ABI643_00460 [Candidatus Doudnabacteria bacterium]
MLTKEEIRLAKANFAINGKEVTVLFHIQDGSDSDCFYCHLDGAVEQHAVTEEVHMEGVKLNRTSKLYHEAETKLKQLMFSGRSLHVGKSCEDKWIEEFHSHPGIMINTP